MSDIANTKLNKRATNQILPPGWRLVQLREVIDISHGFPFSSEYFATDGHFKLLTPGNFYEEGGFRSAGEKQKFYTGAIPDGYLLPPKTLIVAMTEQADGLLGSSALVPQNYQHLHNQRIGRVSVKTDRTLPEYLFYLFNGKHFRSKVRETAAGTKVKHTSPEKLTSIEVALPSCEEQAAISSALSDTNSLICSLDQLIAKKRDIQQAAMQQLLTGKRRLPGFSEEWEVKRLGDTCKITTGKKDVNEGNPSGQYPFFTCARENTYSDYYSFDCEAILVAGNGEVGNLNYYSGKFEAYQRTYIIYGFSANPKYIWHTLKSSLAESLGIGKIGSSIPYIKKSDLTNFELPRPSLEEQAAITNALSDIAAELAALEARRDKARQIKQGMMQELLTGRIRLV